MKECNFQLVVQIGQDFNWSYSTNGLQLSNKYKYNTGHLIILNNNHDFISHYLFSMENGMRKPAPFAAKNNITIFKSLGSLEGKLEINQFATLKILYSVSGDSTS